MVDLDIDVKMTLSVLVEFVWIMTWACAEVCTIQRMEITSNLKYTKDKKIQLMQKFRFVNNLFCGFNTQRLILGRIYEKSNGN